MRAEKKIRVCMIMATYLPVWGGAQRQLARLMEFFPENSFEISLLTRMVPGAARHERSGNLDIYRVFVTGRSRLLDSLLYTALALAWLVKNRSRFDILHCYQIYSPAMIGVIAKKILGDKKVLVKVTASNEFGETREIRRLPFTRLRLRLLKEVDRFIVMSDGMSSEITGLGIDASRIRYIPNGVISPDESAFDEESKKKRKERLGLAGMSVGVFTGRLSAEKNIDKLLLAWKTVRRERPDAVLLILGEGGKYRNVEEGLLRLHAELGLDDAVRFMGKVGDVYDYLLASDIFILPSVSEGLSNSLLEAMASGLGVIAGDNDGNRHIVRDRKNGLIVDPENTRGIAAAAIELFGNADLRDSLGREAKRTVKERFSMEKVADEHIRLYREMIGEAGKR